MDRADRNGLAVAAVGHLLLFAALTITIAHRAPPVEPRMEAMDVQLVDTAGLHSAASQPATEAPREMQAPDQGTPAEAPPPTPSAAVSDPAPTQPAPVLPQPAPSLAKPAPAEPVPTRAKPQAPSKPIADILKDLHATARSERSGSDAQAKSDHASAARVGSLLKGVIGASAGKGETARATVAGAAMNGLAAAIKRQVQPCFDRRPIVGPGAERIKTELLLRFKPDGSLSAQPVMTGQSGVDDANRRYAQRAAEVAIAAVSECSPLHLPSELYSGGWESIQPTFSQTGH